MLIIIFSLRLDLPGSNIDQNFRKMNCFFTNLTKKLRWHGRVFKISFLNGEWSHRKHLVQDQLQGIGWSLTIPSKIHLVQDQLQGIGWSLTIPSKIHLVQDQLKGIGWSLTMPSKICLVQDQLQGIGWSLTIPSKI